MRGHLRQVVGKVHPTGLGKPENENWVNYKLGQFIPNSEDHKDIYLLADLKTGLWKKFTANAHKQVLFNQLQGLFEDPRQARNE